MVPTGGPYGVDRNSREWNASSSRKTGWTRTPKLNRSLRRKFGLPMDTITFLLASRRKPDRYTMCAYPSMPLFDSGSGSMLPMWAAMPSICFRFGIGEPGNGSGTSTSPGCWCTSPTKATSPRGTLAGMRTASLRHTEYDAADHRRRHEAGRSSSCGIADFVVHRFTDSRYAGALAAMGRTASRGIALTVYDVVDRSEQSSQ